MQNCSLGSHVSMEKALKEAGFLVEKTVKRGKKTVITVTRKQQEGGRQRVERQFKKKY